jgi:hypothetical protein
VTFIPMCFCCSFSVRYLPIDPLDRAVVFLTLQSNSIHLDWPREDCAAESRPHETLREHCHWDTYQKPSITGQVRLLRL